MAVMQQEACGAWSSVLRDSEKGSSNSPLYNVVYELNETSFIERDVGTLVGKEVGEVIAGQRSTNIFAGLHQQRYFFTPYDRLYLPLISAWFRWLDWIS